MHGPQTFHENREAPMPSPMQLKGTLSRDDEPENASRLLRRANGALSMSSVIREMGGERLLVVLRMCAWRCGPGGFDCAAPRSRIWAWD